MTKKDSTMAKFKDFGVGKESKEVEDVSFKLHGEDFHCVKQIQGKVLLDLIAKSSSDDPSVSAEIMSGFFKNVLTDESYKKFDKLVHDKEKIVHVETLSEIVGWLIGQYSDRPESQPEASSTGQ
jgi:hypothetical protein